MNNVSENKLKQTAKRQLHRTNSDVVICNDLKVIKEGIHKAFAVTQHSTRELKGKQDIANYIVR